MADLKDMKGVSDKDKAMIAEAEQLLGAEPEAMGVVKNYFWGRIREELLFPYPQAIPADEVAACDQLVARLEDYLRNEHPSILIDQDQEIPRWVVDRLFEMGVLGMTIPKEHGGLGMGITSYNRVLETIGKYCGSTAVMVSAHQSIGCKAVMLFGNDEQKAKWLPHLAKDWLSAFCLSEPNVGCDAGGQETYCEKTEDGEFFIINGEKKWATSGALSGLFTVMAKQKMEGGKEKVTALVCTPDMEGIDIFQKNRSKCGIRGTWQARIRFKNVRVPKAHLLGQEGKGLNIALTCLNYGRCTLSAGMLGGARRAMDQSIKWSQTRFQFKRALSEFELVRQKVARMAAYVYAMDAVLYMTTGYLDRHDEDIMVETAICKVFNSEFGWRAVNDAVQIMGGEGYMTENEVERIFRDSRINIIVEGANEVMQSFVFAYGGKQLAEHMLGVRDAAKKSPFKPAVMKAGMPIAKEVFLGIRPSLPRLTKVHPSLNRQSERLCRLVREHTYQFKMASKRHDAKIIERQCVQARLADAAILIHAFACTLSKLDMDLRQANGGPASAEFARDKAAAEHFFDLAEKEIDQNYRALNDDITEQADESMLKAAEAALAYSSTLPAEHFVIPERTPTDLRGKGRTPRQEGVRQFPGDKYANA
ncbi:MAG: acyl-CoA dehydrogenase family protein [Phycisphaerales bacterium]